MKNTWTVQQIREDYIEQIGIIEEACQCESIEINLRREETIERLLDLGLNRKQAEAALRDDKHPGGRPSGPKMPCGWCGRALTASEIRKHFVDCPKRPVS